MGNKINELQHHGVMGMKWGVRRYQNKDGSLTAAGRSRYAEVAGNSKLQARDAKDAIRVYRKNEQRHRAISKSSARTADKAYDKASKLNDKYSAANEAGRVKASDKYAAKTKKYLTKAMFNDAKSQAETILANRSSTKISKIQSGTLKAGSDFIVQRDYNVYVLPGFFAVGKEIKIIE